MTEGTPYVDGQIVNGHRFNAAANTWDPLPPQESVAAPADATSPVVGADPAPSSAATGTTQVAPAPAPAAAATGAAQGSNGLATAGFVLALLGLLGSWIPLLNVVGILLAVIGVVLAAVGLAKSKKVGSGKGLAIAGLVLGGLAILVAVVINAAFANSVDDAIDKTTATDVKTPPGSSAGANSGSDAGATRDNPAPIGSAVSSDDWTVKVNSVSTVKTDSLGQKAKAGNTLLVINVTAIYNGDDPQGQTAWASVKFVTADGSTIDITDGFFIADKSFDSMKKLYSGASVTGNKILEVPAGWEGGVLAVSPDLLSDDTFVAVK